MRGKTAAKVALPAAVFAAVTTLILTVGHQSPTSLASTVPKLTATHATVPRADADIAMQVRERVRAALPAAQVAVEVFDRRTGTVLTRLDPDRQFASMSVVKLLIALDVLRAGHWEVPDAHTQARLTRMISASDDTIASAFWVQQGGDALVTRVAHLLGLHGTQPPATPGQWGSTRITAEDVVTVYRYLEESLPRPARDLLYRALCRAPATAADGKYQYFGIPDALPGTTWAIKQGWGTSDGKAFHHTTGLLGADARYVVVVLSSAPLRSYVALPPALTAGTAALRPLLT
ncbi:hypothetical protein [Amycolatopsis granulosa]|uniref:hypothetical protein n=1 Tax=Amycolatopsis granulosa TaxID=185684 RepID=UPI0014233A4E|nr:hypothetical protein [Amycolatopsis granulosa]NIH88110.1 hypothetical protein [Amycolatopsis granulosa]